MLQDVGTRAMGSLVAVLQHDAPHDTDIAKAALETLMQLCEVAEKPTKEDMGLRFTDEFLQVSRSCPHTKPLRCVFSCTSV